MCINTMRRVNHLEKILLFILGGRKFAIVNHKYVYGRYSFHILSGYANKLNLDLKINTKR